MARIANLSSLYESAETKLKSIFLDQDTPPADTFDIIKEYDLSRAVLDSYVTLDHVHTLHIRKLRIDIILYAKDMTRRRPYSISLVASPGSGKSHFVNCLSKSLSDFDVAPVLYNMSIFQKPDDLIQPLEEVRNLKVQDKLPILFIDEFDADERNISALLPLLWDGEVHLGQTELKLGKLVVILAGSNNELKNFKKYPDLQSRLNGGQFRIPNLETNSSKHDRRVDKICQSVSLIKRRFPKLEKIPWALLKFIAETKFIYGVRSIALLIDFLPMTIQEKSIMTIKDLNLPISSKSKFFNSSLKLHIDLTKIDIESFIDKWSKLMQYDALVKISEEHKSEEHLDVEDMLATLSFQENKDENDNLTTSFPKVAIKPKALDQPSPQKTKSPKKTTTPENTLGYWLEKGSTNNIFFELNKKSHSKLPSRVQKILKQAPGYLLNKPIDKVKSSDIINLPKLGNKSWKIFDDARKMTK